MSTITKEDIIGYTLSDKADLNLIVDYCKEKGKEESAISELIGFLLNDGFFLIPHFYKIALEYFQAKYEIVLIHNKNGILITAY